MQKKGAEPRSNNAVERASPRAQKAPAGRASFEMVRGHDARSARADVSPEAARYPGTMNWEDTRRRGTKQRKTCVTRVHTQQQQQQHKHKQQQQLKQLKQQQRKHKQTQHNNTTKTNPQSFRRHVLCLQRLCTFLFGRNVHVIDVFLRTEEDIIRFVCALICSKSCISFSLSVSANLCYCSGQPVHGGVFV